MKKYSMLVISLDIQRFILQCLLLDHLLIQFDQIRIDSVLIQTAQVLNRTIPVILSQTKSRRLVPFRTRRWQFQNRSILMTNVVQHEQSNLSGDRSKRRKPGQITSIIIYYNFIFKIVSISLIKFKFLNSYLSDTFWIW